MWQPIETAPKDKKILLACGDVLTVGGWDDGKYSAKKKARWWTENGLLFGKRWDMDNQPTHWMPLPEPPVPA